MASCTGEDGTVARVLGELGWEHGTVERNESCQEREEEEPSLPCCRGQWWEEQQGWLQGHSGVNQQGKSRSIPLLCCAICGAEETLQSCQWRCCAGAADTPTAAGVHWGLPPEPVLTSGLPALLHPRQPIVLCSCCQAGHPVKDIPILGGLGSGCLPEIKMLLPLPLHRCPEILQQTHPAA